MIAARAKHDENTDITRRRPILITIQVLCLVFTWLVIIFAMTMPDSMKVHPGAGHVLTGFVTSSLLLALYSSYRRFWRPRPIFAGVFTTLAALISLAYVVGWYDW